MPQAVAIAALPESEIAALVDALAAGGAHARLTDLLREDHDIYQQRGRAAIVRVRGWILLGLARVGVTDAALPFVLDELDSGFDAYLVAAAARALRSYNSPSAALAPFVIRALTNMDGHDEPVSFERFGEYAVSSTGTSPIRELLATLEWLGSAARGILPELEAFRAQPGVFPEELRAPADRAIAAVRAGGRTADPECCTLPGGLRGWWTSTHESSDDTAIGTTIFEDHEGKRMTFDDVFQGHPSIVVFFYTRCDNPLKCSLTITKLGRIQQLLAERGLAAQVQTAAITYDPAFDLPHRLRTYGARRGVRLGEGHRMLRAVGGVGPLRRHFKLGVNFIESLVNRHRIEAYVLDVKGRIAFSFERLRWDEREVVERAIDVMGKVMADVSEGPAGPPPRFARRTIGSLTVGTLAAVGWAFFPKCPVCWSGYLSAVGIAGLERIPYSPSLQPLLLAIMIVNLAGAWLRAYSTGRRAGASLATAGVLAIGLSIVGWLNVASWGVALVVGGSALNTLSPRTRQPHADDGYFPGGAASGRVGIEPFDSTSRRAM